jgi:uncharacterized protein with gpF-like domain
MAIYVAKSKTRYFGKADDSEVERLLAQNDRISSRVRQAFLDSIHRIKSQIDVDRIATYLRQGRYQEAIDAVSAQDIALGFAPLASTITASMFQVGHQGAKLATQTHGIQFNFSQVNPKAVSYAQQYEQNLIREITRQTRDNVQRVIRQGVSAGENPLNIARDVRDYIGLTQQQMQAVQNYRGYLSDGDAQALARGLRDRRFDSTVGRAIAGDTTLSDDQIDNMVDRYTQRYLKYRSETIARTEAKRALGAGNQLLWQQAVDDGRAADDEISKTWVTTGDHKVREYHVELDGQTVGLNEPFTGSGGDIMYPGDPAADADMTINCRCTATYRYKSNGQTAPGAGGSGVLDTVRNIVDAIFG